MSETPPLSEVLAAARRAVGLSQAEAGRRLGVATNTVGRWEQGLAAPSDRNLVRALELYEVDVDEVPYGPPRRKLELRIQALEERVDDLQATIRDLVARLPKSDGTD